MSTALRRGLHECSGQAHPPEGPGCSDEPAQTAACDGKRMVLLTRHPKRIIWGLAVTAAVAATFLLWLMPQVGRGQAPVVPVIDTSATVESSQCIPCHV